MKEVYNTGKVKIGLLYEPPKKSEMTRDELRIQEALLDEKRFDFGDKMYYVCYVLILVGLFVGALSVK